MFECVVIVLAIVFDSDRLAKIAELDHNLRIVFIDLDRRDVFNDRFDLVEHIGHEDRVIGSQETT